MNKPFTIHNGDRVSLVDGAQGIVLMVRAIHQNALIAVDGESDSRLVALDEIQKGS